MPLSRHHKGQMIKGARCVYPDGIDLTHYVLNQGYDSQMSGVSNIKEITRHETLVTFRTDLPAKGDRYQGNTRVGSVASNNVSAGRLRICDNPFEQTSDSTAAMAASRCTSGVSLPKMVAILIASIIPASP